jgi:N-acetylmuramoyl-L-alanine amidase
MKRIILALSMLVSSVVVAQAEVNQELYSEQDRPQEYCLALNIYYEARGSNRADRLAVADVVLNRVQDSRYPDTVCDVVKQGRQDSNGNMIRHQCQFSWYCDGKADRPADQDRWIDAQQIAYMVYVLNEYRGLTEGATHYHATYVKPRWARDLQLVGRIGEHIFYRWE